MGFELCRSFLSLAWLRVGEWFKKQGFSFSVVQLVPLSMAQPASLQSEPVGSPTQPVGPLTISRFLFSVIFAQQRDACCATGASTYCSATGATGGATCAAAIKTGGIPNLNRLGHT